MLCFPVAGRPWSSPSPRKVFIPVVPSARRSNWRVTSLPMRAFHGMLLVRRGAPPTGEGTVTSSQGTSMSVLNLGYSPTPVAPVIQWVPSSSRPKGRRSNPKRHPPGSQRKLRNSGWRKRIVVTRNRGYEKRNSVQRWVSGLLVAEPRYQTDRSPRHRTFASLLRCFQV